MTAFIVITSVDPLRIYLTEDCFFRFCPEKYYPFDETNRNKYIVKDTYMSLMAKLNATKDALTEKKSFLARI